MRVRELLEGLAATLPNDLDAEIFVRVGGVEVPLNADGVALVVSAPERRPTTLNGLYTEELIPGTKRIVLVP